MPNLTQNLKTLAGDEQSCPTHSGCGHPSHIPASDRNLFINIITYQQRVSMCTPVATNTKISSQKMHQKIFLMVIYSRCSCTVTVLRSRVANPSNINLMQSRFLLYIIMMVTNFSSTGWSYIQMYRVISLWLSEMTDISISNAIYFNSTRVESAIFRAFTANGNIMQLNPLLICSLI